MTILCYHAVEPGWTAPMSLEPATFARHAEWLSRRRNVVPLTALLDDAAGRAPHGGRDVALTFDDGFASLHEHALPVLSRYGLPSTVFLVGKTLADPQAVVDWVDKPPAHRLATLTLDQIEEMQKAGVAFESHSYSHADLTRLSFEDCVQDLRLGREVLEELLGRPVTLLAYPRGRHNADVRAAARSAGYTHAFTLPERREDPGPLAVPRVGVHYGNSLLHLRVKTSRSYLPVRTNPALCRARVRLARLLTPGRAG